MSPIMESFYASTGIDAVFILAVVVVILLAALILAVTALVKIRGLNRKYSRFMKGGDAASLEDAVMTCIEKAEMVDEQNKTIGADIRKLRINQKITYQKMGMVKYNAFREMSGDLSYALVLLNQNDDGFVINSVYTKEGGYSYIKEIKSGECDIELSPDEKKALDKAKGL